jgi:hypothetical protein
MKRKAKQHEEENNVVNMKAITRHDEETNNVKRRVITHKKK